MLGILDYPSALVWQPVEQKENFEFKFFFSLPCARGRLVGWLGFMVYQPF